MTKRSRAKEVGEAAALIGEDVLRHLAVRVAAFSGFFAIGFGLLDDSGAAAWRIACTVWGAAGLLFLALTTLGGWNRRSQWLACALLLAAGVFTLFGLVVA